MPLQGHCPRKCQTHHLQASPLWKPSHTHTHTQLYGDGDDGELEGNIAPRPKAVVWPLNHLTDRRSVAVTAQALCLFSDAGESHLTCTHKVMTRRIDRCS